MPDTDDPGDATHRNFRYQHAYGAILLAAGHRGDKPYVAIWCEHHEDLLAERSDGKYDGYQIKTSRPENGAWKMNSSDLVKSIGGASSISSKSLATVSGICTSSRTPNMTTARMITRTRSDAGDDLAPS